MDADDVDRIPRGNLRVSRAEFAEVWRTAQVLGRTDAYAAGVAHTCRWMACALTTLNGRRFVSMAPITGTTRLAHEELIEREYLAAEKECIRLQNSDHPDRPYVEGATATLRWAWKGLGGPPVEVPADRAS